MSDKDLSLLGGENPADSNGERNKDIAVIETTGQVKALNTGHTEASLRKQLRAEVDEAWRGNRGLLGNLFSIFGNIFKTGGKLVGAAIGAVGDLFVGVIEGVQGFVGGVANAILGNSKMGFEAIEGAVDERMAPIESTVTKNSEYFTELSLKAEEQMKLQEEATAKAQEAVDALESYKEAKAKEDRETAQKVLAATQTADKALERAATLVSEQGELLGPIKSVMETAEQAVNDLDEYKRAQEKTISDLQAVADDSKKKAEAAQKDLTTLNNDLSNKIKQGVEANQAVKDAVKAATDAGKAAQSAMDQLTNSVDIGASLVPLVPGTRTPAWTAGWQGAPVPTKNGIAPPSGVEGPVVGSPGAIRNTYMPNVYPYVKVAPNTTYLVRFWVWGEKAGSSLYLRAIDQNQNNAVDKVKVINGTLPHPYGAHAIAAGNIPSRKWTLCEREITFKQGVEYVALFTLGFNEESTAITQQYIAGLEIAPRVPDQATIDMLQTNAIMANAKVGSTNATAIDILNAAWAVQETVNKKQQEWNEAATKATTANTEAIRALARRDRGQSLVIYRDLTDQEIADALKKNPNARPEVWKPMWTECTTLYKHRNDDPAFFADTGKNGFNAAEAWGVPPEIQKTNLTANDEPKFMRVEEGRQYKLTYWHKASGPGSRYYIQGWSRPNEPNPFRIVNGTNKETGEPILSGVTTYYVTDMEMPTEWQRVEVIIQIEPGVTGISLNRFYWNHARGSASAHQWITGLDFGPNVPSQRDIDNAQNNSIKALEEASQANKDATAANTEATSALSYAVKLMNKPDTSDSLVHFLEPSEADLKNPKVKPGSIDWLVPEPMLVPEFRQETDPDMGLVFSRNVTGKENVYLKARNMPVKPNTAYLFSYYAKTDTQNTQLAWFVSSPDTRNPVDKLYALRGGSNGYSKTEVEAFGSWIGRDYYAKAYANKWSEFNFIVTFKGDVKSVSLTGVVVNDEDTYTTTNKKVSIAGVRFAPFIPSQADVDRAQNEALEAQKNINKLAEERMWQNRDMIDLLDLQRPRMKSETFMNGSTPYPDNGYLPEKWKHGNDSVGGDFACYRIENDWYLMGRSKRAGTTYLIVAFKGVWDADVTLNLNWDNGAVDQLYFNVYRENRIFAIRAGAAHINLRSSVATMFLRNLRREVSARPAYSNGEYRWVNVKDPHGLIRAGGEGQPYIRLKTPCYMSVPYRGNSARTTIYFTNKFHARDFSGTSTFYEYNYEGDPSMERTTPSSNTSSKDTWLT